jgi:purine-binding chemotaxis protein CheW
MVTPKDKEEGPELVTVPLADDMMEGLLSELLADGETLFSAGESGFADLSEEEPTPPEPLAMEPVPIFQAEETLAALSHATQLDAPLEPVPQPMPVAELVAIPPASVESGSTVHPNAEPAPVEPQIFANPVLENWPVAALARALDPEPESKPIVSAPHESKPAVAPVPPPRPVAPVSVEPRPPVPAVAPSTGLDTLIAAIDSEVAAGPRLTFDTSRDSASGAAIEKKNNCIVFSLDGTRYAVSIHNVIEMDKIPRITPVPNVPAFVRGVTNLRGEIVSVLDLRVLLGLSQSEQPDRGRILVVRAGGGQQTAALVVDEVRGIATIPMGKLKPPAGTIDDKVLPLLSGVSEYENALLNVLSMESLFRSPEIHQLVAN